MLIFDYLPVLLRHLAALVLIPLLAAGAAFAWADSQAPSFRGTATLTLEIENQGQGDNNLDVRNADFFVNTIESWLLDPAFRASVAQYFLDNGMPGVDFWYEKTHRQSVTLMSEFAAPEAAALFANNIGNVLQSEILRYRQATGLPILLGRASSGVYEEGLPTQMIALGGAGIGLLIALLWVAAREAGKVSTEWQLRSRVGGRFLGRFLGAARPWKLCSGKPIIVMRGQLPGELTQGEVSAHIDLAARDAAASLATSRAKSIVLVVEMGRTRLETLEQILRAAGDRELLVMRR